MAFFALTRYVGAPSGGQPPLGPRRSSKRFVQVKLDLFLANAVAAAVLGSREEWEALGDDLHEDPHKLPHLVHRPASGPAVAPRDAAQPVGIRAVEAHAERRVLSTRRMTFHDLKADKDGEG